MALGSSPFPAAKQSYLLNTLFLRVIDTQFGGRARHTRYVSRYIKRNNIYIVLSCYIYHIYNYSTYSTYSSYIYT